MGIKNLNTLLNESCGDIIVKYNFEKLRDKTIVIDTSIYLYKFKGNTNLFGYMYQMLLLFKKYNICPIFIFDGKPPDEKKDLLDKRKKNKNMYEKKIKIIKNNMNNIDYNNAILKKLHLKLLSLKKRTVKITKYDINNIKKLFTLCNIIYFDARGEADVLCANLVKNNIAWACISDDTDLFVHNCPRVLRSIDMINETILFYDTKDILSKLNLSYKEFLMICIATGTDYLLNKCKKFNIYYMIKLYHFYKSDDNNKIHFYKWLQHRNIITDYTLLFYIELNFTYENNNISKYKKILENKNIINTNKVDINNFLKDYNFIFIEGE